VEVLALRDVILGKQNLPEKPKAKTLPLINADDTDLKGKETLPRITTDERGSEEEEE
jgi:hypothetical protein